MNDYSTPCARSSGGFSGVERRGARSELPTLERPTGIPERFDEHVKLMYELQWLAFQADITRVVTFMLGRELNFRTYPEIGITEGHHGLSHHRDNPEQMAKYAKVNIYQTELFAWFLEKLRVDAGRRRHAARSLAVPLRRRPQQSEPARALRPAAGAGRRRRRPLKGGRHLVFPAETPMTNLLLSMLDKVGVPAETLGDSTGGSKC